MTREGSPSPALSVNINKLATLRNARGGNNPDVIHWAKQIQSYGVQGITVHPRPDERHIRRSDVHALKEAVYTEFNIEGYPSEDFIRLVLDVRPTQVTLVPDPPEVLTSNAGWKVEAHEDFLRKTISKFRDAGIRSSIFFDPEVNEQRLEALSRVAPDRVELYTESYAKNFLEDRVQAIAPFKEVASRIAELGLGLNAGHDLDMENLQYFSNQLPTLLEVSIGHALICDALVYGMENALGLYKRALR